MFDFTGLLLERIRGKLSLKEIVVGIIIFTFEAVISSVISSIFAEKSAVRQQNARFLISVHKLLFHGYLPDIRLLLHERRLWQSKDRVLLDLCRQRANVRLHHQVECLLLSLGVFCSLHSAIETHCLILVELDLRDGLRGV